MRKALVVVVVVEPDYRGHDASEGEAGTLTARISYGVDVLNMLAEYSQVSTFDNINLVTIPVNILFRRSR